MSSRFGLSGSKKFGQRQTKMVKACFWHDLKVRVVLLVFKSRYKVSLTLVGGRGLQNPSF